MTRYWLAGAALCAVMAGSAFAQSVPQPTIVIPSGAVSVTTTEHSVDANGVATDRSSTFEKSQTITDGNGELSADTHTLSTSQTTVTVPPPVVTTTTTRTTTTTTE
jgi:hypothetical protein